MTFHPFLLLILVPWTIMLYVTHRGLVRNEFRRRWHSGWHKYEIGTVDYWVATFLNFVFLGAFTFMIYESLTDASFNPPTIKELPPEAVTEFRCTPENPQFCHEDEK